MKHLLFALVLVLSACGPAEPEVFVDRDAPPDSLYLWEVTLDGTRLTSGFGCGGDFEVALRERPSDGTYLTAEKTCGDAVLTLTGFIPDTRATLDMTITTERVGEDATTWEFNGRAK